MRARTCQNTVSFPFLLSFLGACGALFAFSAFADQAGREDDNGRTSSGPPIRKEWALAIHGGAGTIGKDMPAEKRDAYLAEMKATLEMGRDQLKAGKSSLDVVEAVVRRLEDNPLFNAGKGAVFTHEGHNSLDAAIMDGRNLACGSVAGLAAIKHPISLARAVMEKSPHVFLVGEGAEEFAKTVPGIEVVEPKYFYTEERWNQLQDALKREAEAAKAKPEGKASFEDPERVPFKERYGTVGAVALDKEGNLAAATSTGGMTNKRWGRVGDVPVIGAGTYASNESVAVSCTGYGEQFIRHNVAHTVAAMVQYGNMSVGSAAERVIRRQLNVGDGGLIAISRDGSIALEFNSEGMYRGAADSEGRFEVAIWESTNGEATP